jgi:small subunit ribosomal protein S6
MEGGLTRSLQRVGRSPAAALESHRIRRTFRRRTRRLPNRKKEPMALYEHVVISRQDISPQQAEALNDTLKTLIEGGGGSVAKIEYWGLRNLSYRIKKNRKGHYSLLAIDAPAEAVKEMERQLSINEDVLRYLTVRVEELDLELSPILARRDRDRERRDDAPQF